MPRNLLGVAALLLLSASQLKADPGGQPRRHDSKKTDSPKQGADRAHILWIGGYRQDNLWQSGEKWRGDKAQAHRDNKAMRDREAQARQDREASLRADRKGEDAGRKARDIQRRDTEKARQEVKERARDAEGAKRRHDAQLKQDRERAQRQAVKKDGRH